MDYVRAVQYYETDKMGVVHHSNYIRYFEEARTYLMDKTGVNYAEMESMGFMLPVVDVSCKYKIGAKYGDSVVIQTKISSFNGITITFDYTVRSINTGSICAVGSSRHCFVDMTFKPVKLQKSAPDLYQKIQDIIE